MLSPNSVISENCDSMFEAVTALIYQLVEPTEVFIKTSVCTHDTCRAAVFDLRRRTDVININLYHKWSNMLVYEL